MTAALDTLTTLQLRAYDAIAAAAKQLGAAPHTVTVRQVDGKRQAEMWFDNLTAAELWTAWLRWPWTAATGGDQFVMTGRGQWLGFAWQLVATEPNDSTPTEG